MFEGSGFGRLTGVAPGWPQSTDEVRWGVPGAVGAFLGAQLLAVLWVAPAVQLLYGSDPLPDSADRPIWTLLLFNLGLWIGYLAFPVLVKRLSGSGPMKDFNAKLNLAEAGWAAAIGVATQLLFLPVLYWVVVRVLSGDPDSTAEALGDRINNVGDGLLFIVAVVIVAPFVEEWFYRGMLLPTLSRRFGTVAGVVGSSVVFALVHGEVILLPGLFCFALILAWLTTKTGRIGPAVVAHMAFNATTVVQLLLFR